MKRYIKASKVTDYISSEDLHKIMQNPKFGDFETYRQLDGMIVETTQPVQPAFKGANGALQSKRWKFARLNSKTKEFKVYRLDSNNAPIGEEFTVSCE